MPKKNIKKGRRKPSKLQKKVMGAAASAITAALIPVVAKAVVKVLDAKINEKGA
ncbi:MAG: hypothetical protein IKI21_12705 [Oscillospiraceae bacterium]|nr:hypothetical protein [Oscillospiraceae bacterium]